MFSKLFSKIKRKPKEKEPNLWQEEPRNQEEEVESKQPTSFKQSTSKTLASLHQKTIGRIHAPNVKLNPRLIKGKMILAGALGVIYFLSGVFTLPNPFAILPLISAYFLADYIWVLRRLKWLRSGIFKEE